MNPFNYIKEIQEKWQYPQMIKIYWVKSHVKFNSKYEWVMIVEISTGGLSNHEKIIENIDKLFWSICWEYSKRGGHYKFIINPIQWGFKLVNEYAKENNLYRQIIYNTPNKYEWVHVSDKIKFIKPLKEKQDGN